MQFSHSRVDLFTQCKYRYKLRYIDKLKTLPDDNPSNALFLGTALHTGLEKGVDAAIAEYYGNYPIITDAHINEAIKLAEMIPRTKALLPPGGVFEQSIMTSDFIGYMDYLVQVDEVKVRRRMVPVYDLYDFKYSNSDDRYKDSGQLTEYKHFYESQTRRKIRNLYYVMVPKVGIRQGDKESLYGYRNRIIAKCHDVEPHLLPVDYEPERVVKFYQEIKHILECKDFDVKTGGYLCNWCDYKQYCQEDIDYMILPKNERRSLDKISKKTIWIYGAPFSGKTTLANQFPDPLMLNTDGNIKFVDAPYIPIKNSVEVDGRRTITTLAWEVFQDAITELEKKDNDFKTIVVDLLEDTYEHCRIWCYNKLGIEHESDNSFKAWDYVRTQFLSTMKRLMNLDYENIVLISHEDTSKDITKKSGDKITAIKPNIQEKTANKVSGMVDIVARVVADGNVRTLNFKSDEVIFGGGRLKAEDCKIPLEYDALMEVYGEALKGGIVKEEQPKKRGRRAKKEEAVEAPEESVNDEEPVIQEETKPVEESEPVEEEKPKRRRSRKVKDETQVEEPQQAEEKVEEKPKTRRSRKTKPVDEVKYWMDPVSGCVTKTVGDEEPDDEFIQEICEDAFNIALDEAAKNWTPGGGGDEFIHEHKYWMDPTSGCVCKTPIDKKPDDEYTQEITKAVFERLMGKPVESDDDVPFDDGEAIEEAPKRTRRTRKARD